VTRGQGERETERLRDKEKGRRGEKETERLRDKENGRK
jgi:hypothetical protein